MNETKTHKYLPCDETPENCNFQSIDFAPGGVFSNTDKGMNYIVFCQEGKICLTSSLFREETLQSGEILFLPRMADCRGEIVEDTRMVVHTFNNTVCRPENCILNYLYTHKKAGDNGETPAYHCKLAAHEVIVTFMQSICHYLADGTGDLLLWHLKHKELIRLFSRYYNAEELQTFFRPMTGESVPFRSIVLSHYQRATDTNVLAELCGYEVANFRRVFKEEFGIPVHQWLIRKRGEHILYRPSLPDLPFRDIMEEFGFATAQQFNRFCKTYLGDSPTHLRNRYKKE